MLVMDFLQNIPYYWTKQLDPRVANLLLVGSSYQVPLIIFAYLYFVLSCGPRFMKNRSPYSLRIFMKLYNIVQVLGNAWVIYEFIDAGLFSLPLVCPRIDYSYNYIPMRITRCIWHFFLLKVLDYVDTFVFVLRKKDNQVSPLHLYHHVSTLALTWISVRYYAVTGMGVTNIINSFIHTIMYTYYFLAAWGPSVKRAIEPMKRCITMLQMIQLMLLILYALQYIVLDCTDGNNIIVITFITNAVINLYMFRKFYRKTYKNGEKIQ
ncbi:PREDICTED: elongation of very long chain fatty acids protein AAEL008004-like [Vollenhovia emeryi]|uniref:elongation of very long chain fatty acids protein AAEL008004-like n=1 Tax=Vollenhovia emeryi TaxID=411798 RepID=UPI0005F4DE88|nr:PREDICTED: elongation of very long chain fatty acids protein AAEL008004-like [Vollenhovia emeryi]